MVSERTIGCFEKTVDYVTLMSDNSIRVSRGVNVQVEKVVEM